MNKNFRLNLKRTLPLFKKQRGFDLIQLSIVTAIIGILIAGSLQVVPIVLQSTKLNREITDLALIHSRLKDIFGDGPVTNITAQQTTSLDIFPEEWKAAAGTQTFVSRLGGEAKLTVTGINPNEANLTIPYSPKNCVAVVQGAKGIFNEVKIGATKIAENGKLEDNNLFTQCTSGSDDKVVSFVFKP